MIVSFTIPDAVATELNQIAVKAGFPNAKQMMIAYLKATVKASRENAIFILASGIDISDVDIN